jgi:hypothetical protein
MARGRRQRGPRFPLTRFLLEFPILPLAEPREQRYIAEIAQEWPHCLDIRALTAMFCATFGKLSACHA